MPIQREVTARSAQAKIGDPVYADFEEVSLTNSDPQAVERWTVAVINATNTTTYILTFMFDGTTRAVQFVSDASATIAEIYAGLLAAIERDPVVSGWVDTVNSATPNIICDAQYPGLTFTVASNSADVTAVQTTAAADANSIPFGVLCVSRGFIANEINELGARIRAGQFVAQVTDLDVPYVAGTEYEIGVTYRGIRYHVRTTGAVSQAATIAALVVALNAILPVVSVTAAAAAGPLLRLTSDTVGEEFFVSWGVSDDGATDPVIAVNATNRSRLTSVNLAVRGISIYSRDVENETVQGDDPAYDPNSSFGCVRKGVVWVQNAEAITQLQEVFVELAIAGGLNGRLYQAEAGLTTSVRIDPRLMRWERDERTDQSSFVAAVQMDITGLGVSPIE